MARPIVVLMPEKERAVLRNSGVLPFDFFQADNANGVRLWPYDIDYNAGRAVAERIADHPGDVPVFFGIPPSTTSSEINERTAEIVSVLNSVMVHVVFLDDAGADGKIGYGHFGSFSDIVAWSQALLKVLKVRFVNELDLLGLENVLVIVVRSQQIKITQDEISAFESIVGASSRSDVKPFRSCYFLNHELSIDSGLEDIFADNVWDILVARLLKVFALSREQCGSGAHASQAVWMRPGIKVWKCEECEPGGVASACRSKTEAALEAVDDLIRKASTESDAHVELQDPSSIGRPGGEIDPLNLTDAPGKNWYSFDPVAFVEDVANSASRNRQIVDSARSYVAWRGRSCTVDSTERAHVFASVKESPSRLFAWRAALERNLADGATHPPAASRFKSLVAQLMDLEDRRRNMLSTLSSDDGEDSAGKRSEGMAQSLRKAQLHFVGLGAACCVVSAVVSFFGWLSWQAVKFLDAPPACAVALTGAVCLGAVSAMALLLTLQARAGRRGVAAFVKTCDALDRLVVERVNLSREILCLSVERRVKSAHLNSRIAIRELLDRIARTLVHEIHYAPAVTALSGAKHGSNMSAFMRRQREEYLSKTHTEVSLPVGFVPADEVKTMVVDLWWAHEGANLKKFWGEFSRRYDVRNAGHFPVSVFIPEVRAFMSRFVRASRFSFRQLMDEQCFDAKMAGAKKWFAESEKARFYSAKAAKNPRAPVSMRLVFVPANEDPRFLDELRNCNNTVSTVFYESALLPEFETSGMALSYHEVRVDVERDPELGVLKLRQSAEEEAAR